MQNLNQPTVIVIFGASGNLTQRKLVPALYNLSKQGLLPDQIKIVGVARRDLNDDSFREQLKNAIQQFHKSSYDETSWNLFTKSIRYYMGDFGNKSAFSRLADELNEIDEQLGVCTHKIFHLAISPDLFRTVFDGIKATQLHQICKNHENTRVIIEKPFGRDLKTFKELNQHVLSVFKEPQVLRIDHFLGKETVQNLLYFRAANSVFTGWDSKRIERIRVNVYESIGIDSRAGYYDAFGHTRDMVQSHLLQLAAITLMSVPKELSPELIKKGRAQVISSLRIKDLSQDLLRAQYTEGVVDGKTVKGYRNEENVPAESATETLVRISASLESDLWDGLKLEMVSGKRLSDKRTEIIVDYRGLDITSGIQADNKLIFRIQPREGITLKLRVKKPTSEDLEFADMNFEYKDSFQTILPDAYEKILLDAIRKHSGNFLSTEELEAAWRFVGPILEYWQQSSEDLKFYPAGSNELIE